MTILSEELPERSGPKPFMPTRPEYERLLKVDAERAVLARRLEAARQALLACACRCSIWAPHEADCMYARRWAEVMSVEIPPLAPE